MKIELSVRNNLFQHSTKFKRQSLEITGLKRPLWSHVLMGPVTKISLGFHMHRGPDRLYPWVSSQSRPSINMPGCEKKIMHSFLDRRTIHTPRIEKKSVFPLSLKVGNTLCTTTKFWGDWKIQSLFWIFTFFLNRTIVILNLFPLDERSKLFCVDVIFLIVFFFLLLF